MEQKSNITRAETAARVDVIKAMGESAAQSVKNNPDLARAFIEKIAGEEFFKLENKEKIVQKTIEIVVDNPEKLQNEQTDEPLDPDWMNSFVAFSERASSDSLQTLWARVLSGEITQPGSYSLPTLRIISEIGLETAKLFERYLDFSIGVDVIATSSDLKGHELMNFLELENSGLVVQSAAGLGLNFNCDKNGQMRFSAGNFSLQLKGKENQKFRIPIVKLSKSGIEIKSIIPSNNSYSGLKLVGDGIKSNFDAVSIHETATGKLIKKIK